MMQKYNFLFAYIFHCDVSEMEMLDIFTIFKFPPILFYSYTQDLFNLNSNASHPKLTRDNH
jgi:hypothetical protein